jgi:hypothetical protein
MMTPGYLALTCAKDASGSRVIYVSLAIEPDAGSDSVLFLNTMREEPKDLMQRAKVAHDLSLEPSVRN